MPDYASGKIYTIRCRTDDTMIYVGSTIQPLAKRWGGHKKDSKQERNINRLIYKTINNDWDNWYIELYELYPCSCRNELERREGEIIRLIGNLNKEIAGRTGKEYYEDNKEKIAEYEKIYREVYKEKIAECKKKYYEANKEKKKQYYQRKKQEKQEINNILII